MNLEPRRSFIATLLTGIVLVGCGGGTDDEARELATRSILEDPPPLKEALVSRAQIEEAPPGSAEREFLSLWSTLQYQAWADAVVTYSPALRRALGEDQLVEALKGQAAYFRAVKPRLRQTLRNGDRATIRYVITDVSGNDVPRSASFIRTADGWKVFYDPFIDGALNESVQRSTQMSIDPLARKPSKQALSAGVGASRLQSQYLKRVLRKPAASTSAGEVP